MKAYRIWIVAALVVSILNLPVAASARGEMISTSTIVADLNHRQIQENVNEFLGRSDVQEQLRSQGLNPEEVQQRLAGLSDAELQQIAGQIQKQKAGGDVIVIGLGTILIVILILLLLRRI
jgi:hypothetical protein